MLKLKISIFNVVVVGLFLPAHQVSAMQSGEETQEVQTERKTIDAESEQNEIGKIQDVIVTAQKIRQSSAKVAASLAVVSGESLKEKGIWNAANLTAHIPGIHIGAGNLNSTEIVIRGIGSSTNSELGDPAAAFHIDGIYMGRSQGAGAAFFDLARVEVLRGPQGTLYGRNANAGAVNLISNRPSPFFESSIDVEFGNYHSQKINAILNMPVNEAFALRMAILSSKHDGYTRANVVGTNAFFAPDDQNNLSARVSGLLKFSSSASWLLIADTSKNTGFGPAAFNLENGRLASFQNVLAFMPSIVNDKHDGITSELNIGMGAADLTYLYGHRQSSTDDKATTGVSAGLFYTYKNRFKQDSHEIRLHSTGTGPVQWTAGLYSFNEIGRDIDQPIYLATTPSSLGLPVALDSVLAEPTSICGFLLPCFEYQRSRNDPANNSSKAAFAQATYAIQNDWRVIGGVRENRDEKSRNGERLFFHDIGVQEKIINSASNSTSKLSFKMGVEHDISATQLAYLTLATGYKSGGFTDGNQLSTTTPGYKSILYFAPEKIASLEAGLKGQFMDGRVQLNASAFHYDYTNLQVVSAVDLQIVTTNAAKASVSGMELEGVAKSSRHGHVNFGLGLLSSRYDQYITAGGSDYGGHRLDRSPKMTLNLGYSHDWELENGNLISALVSSRYTAAYTLTDPGTLTYGAHSFVQAATRKSNLVLSFHENSHRWKVQAFVNNIENKRSLTSLTSVSLSSESVFLSESRTFGLRLSLVR